jgi:hypothetical protein
VAHLAWACPHGNARQGASIDGEDPLSGQVVALCHPRTQAWADPCQGSEQRPFEIEGMTAHGRATGVRLQMNPPALISIRRLVAELALPWRVEAPRARALVWSSSLPSVQVSVI